MPGWDALAAPVPWLAPYEAARQRLLAARRPGAGLVATANRALADGPAVAHPAGALRFVPQAALPAGEPYEAFIARTACVPTREHLHDAFQVLAWLAFPALKVRLNALQAAELARRGVGPVRGPLRDAATLFDENGALWAPPAVLREALAARDWTGLFVRHRAAWRDAPPPCLLGHALLEKLAVAPRKGITAHVALLPWGASPDAALDTVLTPGVLATKPFLPLPVLGVPGWWNANASPGFYDDGAVFRPRTG